MSPVIYTIPWRLIWRLWERGRPGVSDLVTPSLLVVTYNMTDMSNENVIYVYSKTEGG